MASHVICPCCCRELCMAAQAPIVDRIAPGACPVTGASPHRCEDHPAFANLEAIVPEVLA